MGDVTVSTNETEIYYPSDWLIEGGPPLDVAGCPPLAEDSVEDVDPLQLIYNKNTEFFGIVHNGYIVMESKNAKDLAGYMQEYVEQFQDWLANNAD